MPELSLVRPTTVQEIIEKNNSPRGKVKVSEKPNDHLDKNAFLKLLVTQLAKQDPLAPVNDREFIAQMAQFSSLEQMSLVAQSVGQLKSFQANFLLGREVTGKDFLTGRELNGRVEKVFYDNTGEVFLKVGPGSIRFQDISAIGENVSRETKTNPQEEKLVQLLEKLLDKENPSEQNKEALLNQNNSKNKEE